jgi:hypothetical protein
MRRYRLRRVALHPTPRRSQRRLTPFFSSLLEFRVLTIATLALWLTYAAAVAGSIWLSRRFVGEVGRRAALLLAALPLVFVGKAMFLGRLYGPADLYTPYPPWRAPAALAGVAPPANPILSDLAFANIPWRAAVREAAANGRFPFWNRFVLAGNPLLASAQAGIFHPSTWAGLPLPLPQSWTFSCSFTIFLSLLAGFLFFRDLELSEGASLLGAAGWGFSTYLIFWNGWSVGPSTATFPLLLVGLRRIATGGPRGVGLTVAGLLLSLCGGHPESFFHTTVAAGALFSAALLAEEIRRSRARAGSAGPAGPAPRRALLQAFGAGVVAFLLAGPQLFPLLEAIPHSAEYRARRAQVDAGAARQSVPAREAARRLVPAALPFAHGIYGKSLVQAEREDGSGMPLAYAGAVLFPLAALGLTSRRPARALFAACLAAGLLLGASAPGLLDLLVRMPGFALALNYRLVFLAGFGLAGLAALGGEEAFERGRAGRLARAAFSTGVLLVLARAAASGLLRERALPDPFVAREFLFELVPVILLAAGALWWRGGGPRLAAAALALLVVQRGLEMGGTYPSLPGSVLTPSVPALEALRGSSARVGAAGADLRPNGAALFRLEDVRGYESIVLDRFADTFPLWCEAQPASFNRISDLTRPFLTFLGMRFAVGAPDAPVPPGWRLYSRSDAAAVFENPRALPRAFVPARIVEEANGQRTLAAMAQASDFSDAAWVAGAAGAPQERNPPARLTVREIGPDLLLESEAAAPFFAATSLPDWPGWRAETSNGPLRLATVNHAFVGVRMPAGSQRVRLSYRPPAFLPGLGAFAFGVVAASLLAIAARRGAVRSGG